jgi:flagellar basal-body rod protein FlgC
MNLGTSMQLAFAGMGAQGERLKIIAENLANSDSTSQAPGGTPYQRKIVSFRSVLDRSLNATTPKIGTPVIQTSGFEKRYDPTNPGADGSGYVLLPNVNPMIELMDMREAQQSYQANLNVIDAAKAMMSRTIDLLRS